MPRQLTYEITLTHVMNGSQSKYTAQSAEDVVRTINNHYGLNILTINSVSRLIGGKQKPSKHQEGIHILRRQNKTATFPTGLGGQYPPSSI
jgi:hypothetical protein